MRKMAKSNLVGVTGNVEQQPEPETLNPAETAKLLGFDPFAVSEKETEEIQRQQQESENAAPRRKAQASNGNPPAEEDQVEDSEAGEGEVEEEAADEGTAGGDEGEEKEARTDR